MTEPTGGQWTKVEALWRGSAHSGSGQSLTRPRWRRLGLLELAIPVGLVLLATVAAREHRDVWGATAAALMLLQSFGFAAIAWWGRRAARNLLAESTRAFLTEWRRDCRQQMVTTRIVAVVLALEALALGGWLWVGIAGGPGGFVRAELGWVVSLAALLGAAGWLLLVRGRLLREFDRIVATKTELGDD